MQQEVDFKIYLKHLEIVVCAMTHIYNLSRGGAAGLRHCGSAAGLGLASLFKTSLSATAYAGLLNNTVLSP